MIWKPAKLSREQMEERRREGARLIRRGKLSRAEIARQLGVSRRAVENWAQTLKAGGLRRLRRRKASGRPPKLSPAQQGQLKRLIRRGALAAGFESDRWTLARIRQLINQEFKIVYHRNYLNRLLRKLGLTPQVPLPRAVERDEELIRAWIEHDWPRIKKGAAQRREHRVFR
jgi:putative transposase